MNKTERSATLVPAVGAQVERGVRALPPEGAWVAALGDDGAYPEIARVRDSYRDSSGEGFLDLVMYSYTGEKLGRTSPAMGGPKSFEPCCGPDRWVEIRAPSFSDLVAARFGYRDLLVPLRPNVPLERRRQASAPSGG